MSEHRKLLARHLVAHADGKTECVAEFEFELDRLYRTAPEGDRDWIAGVVIENLNCDRSVRNVDLLREVAFG